MASFPHRISTRALEIAADASACHSMDTTRGHKAVTGSCNARNSLHTGIDPTNLRLSAGTRYMPSHDRQLLLHRLRSASR